MSYPNTTRAIVAHDPSTASTPPPVLTLEMLHLGPIGDDEVLVEMVATGICHSDIIVTTVPSGAMGSQYPKVVGHEGSGYARAVGRNVTKVLPGDPVLLSFAFCGSCRLCVSGQPCYCSKFAPLNVIGEKTFKKEDGTEVWGSFFGQSSFAQWSVVKAASVVNAKDLIKDEEELKLFAPLGCGIQTGSGAVINTAQATAADQVLVMGLGGVGLSAIMAAKLTGCRTIIGIDRVASRLRLAKELGATHTFDTSDTSHDMIEQVLKYTGGEGASILIEAVGLPLFLDKALDMTSRKGKLVLVGIPPPDYEMKISPLVLCGGGQTIVGTCEGNSMPEKYIPLLIQWYRECKFPLEKLIKFIPVESFQEALSEMKSGATVKPVLTW